MDAAPVSLLGPPAAGGPLVSVPVWLPRRGRVAGRAAGPTKLARMVRDLADMYSTHCECAGSAHCPCAQEAATAVGAALDNAVDREFAPPNMYYRSKDGYAFRLRGFQEAKTHMNGGLKHDKFLALEPITARWRQPRALEPAPVAAPKIEHTGLEPIKVPARFVSTPGAETYASAHFVRKVTDDDVVAYTPRQYQEASAAPPYGTSAVGVVGRWLQGGYPHTYKSKKVSTAARGGHGTRHGVRFPSASGRTADASVSAPTQLGQQQTTQLWEFNYVPLADEEFPGKHPTVFEQQALKEAYLEHLAEACKQDAERCMAACKENPEACKEFSEAKEENEEDKGGDPGNLEDDLDDLDAMMRKLGVPDYTKMILSLLQTTPPSPSPTRRAKRQTLLTGSTPTMTMPCDPSGWWRARATFQRWMPTSMRREPCWKTTRGSRGAERALRASSNTPPVRAARCGPTLRASMVGSRTMVPIEGLKGGE